MSQETLHFSVAPSLVSFPHALETLRKRLGDHFGQGLACQTAELAREAVRFFGFDAQGHERSFLETLSS